MTRSLIANIGAADVSRSVWSWSSSSISATIPIAESSCGDSVGADPRLITGNTTGDIDNADDESPV